MILIPEIEKCPIYSCFYTFFASFSPQVEFVSLRDQAPKGVCFVEVRFNCLVDGATIFQTTNNIYGCIVIVCFYDVITFCHIRYFSLQNRQKAIIEITESSTSDFLCPSQFDQAGDLYLLQISLIFGALLRISIRKRA